MVERWLQGLQAERAFSRSTARTCRMRGARRFQRFTVTDQEIRPFKPSSTRHAGLSGSPYLGARPCFLALPAGVRSTMTLLSARRSRSCSRREMWKCSSRMVPRRWVQMGDRPGSAGRTRATRRPGTCRARGIAKSAHPARWSHRATDCARSRDLHLAGTLSRGG